MKTYPLHNKTIYLLRHGLATTSKWGYGRRKMTADLLPQGEQVVEKIANYCKGIPDSYNVSSDIPRCRHTAEIISLATGKSFSFDKRLTEYYRESFADLKKRVARFLEEALLVKEKNIIICTHGSVIAAMIHLIIKGEFVFRDRLDYPKEGELVVIKGNREIKNISFLDP